MKALCSDPDTQNYLSHSGIEWSFNLEKAPWWGGLFERMIKSVKRCLRKVVGRAKFSYDELHTAIVEIEAIVNSRPLSYVHPDDHEEPLTPSHLLVGRRLLSLPDYLNHLQPEDDPDFELTAESLERQAKHLGNVINHFWKRWRHEYLLNLRQSHCQQRSRGSSRDISPGDIVIVHNEDLPRAFWKLARVLRLITGKDEKTRGAVLQVAGSSTTLQRPLQLLYPLEVSSGPFPLTNAETEGIGETQNPTDPTPGDEHTQPTPGGVQRTRPSRRAAVEGREHVRQWCQDVIDHESVVNWGEDVVD